MLDFLDAEEDRRGGTFSIATDREQWHAGSPILDLNPFGRAQTRKYRPIVSVLPVLRQWLAAELAEYERVGAGHLVNSHRRSVFDVDCAWSSMLSGRKLPMGPEWKPYLLRHSLATILRNRGGTRWDLRGFMGHDVRGSTEVYAVGRFGTIVRTLEDNLGEIETRSQRLCAGSAPNSGYPAIIKGRSK